MRTSATIFIGLMLAFATSSTAQTLNTDPDSAQIVTSDIENFWRAYDRLEANSTRDDSLRSLFENYYLPASPGLVAFIRTRIGSVYDLLAALRERPGYYAAIRPNTLRVREMEPTIREGLRRMKALYPDAVLPDIYFLIGRMNSAGTLSDEGLYLGTEMLSRDDATPTDELSDWLQAVTTSAKTIPCVVVHELVHYQQDFSETQSLLGQALREGVADFLAEQAVGCHGNASAYAWAVARERELWAEFREAMHTTEYGQWLYNGGRVTGRPADLGYWMGYQIARAYYDQAEDKEEAVRDMLHIQDYDAFLDVSGYGDRFEE